MAVYSLTDYKVIVELPEKIRKVLGSNQSSVILGGAQSYLESITIRHNEDSFTVRGDATGSYVHTFNANRTGEIELSINQVSTSSQLLSKIFSIYFNKIDKDGVYDTLDSISMITVQNRRTGEIVAKAKDSFLKRNTEKKFSNEAQYETWTFVSGEIEFYPQTTK